jgi:hypothetical protein
VTQQKAVVEKCTDRFRRGDLVQILSCLSDDVVWALHGTKTLVGTVAVVGHGSVSLGGDPHAFVYSEVFTFTGGLVSRLDTFHIWLGATTE